MEPTESSIVSGKLDKSKVSWYNIGKRGGVGKWSMGSLFVGAPEYQPGDVLGFSSRSCLGIWINLGTFGVPLVGLSHVGVVIAHPETGELVLCESTTLAPWKCCIRGQRTSGVQCQRIDRRVERYQGTVWRYPLAIPLITDQSERLTSYCVHSLGTRYDMDGAFRARVLGFGWLHRLLFGRDEDLTSLFCSEFVAAALRSIGQFRTSSASNWNPNKLTRELRRRAVCLKPERLK